MNLGFNLVKGMGIPLGSNDLMPVKIAGYRLPTDCLVDVRGSKKIVKTEIPGAAMIGTVKEYIGLNDFDITLHCVMQGQSYEGVIGSVREQLMQLIYIWYMEDALAIVCDRTDDFGIDEVVFESFSLPMQQGMEATEIMTLNFISDFSYDLEEV